MTTTLSHRRAVRVLAGGVTLNILIEELPEERQSQCCLLHSAHSAMSSSCCRRGSPAKAALFARPEIGLVFALSALYRQERRAIFAFKGKTRAMSFQSCETNPDEGMAGEARLMVIVVEHDPLSRAALMDLLMNDGYRVFAAHNPEDALSCIERNKDPAALLADSDMPGWKALIQKTRDAAPHTVVIAMLGNDAIADPVDLRRHGVKAWFFKPLVYDDIRRAIESGSTLPLTGNDRPVQKSESRGDG